MSFFYFRFVCIRWYRFLSHLCRSLLGFGFQDGGEASERFTQTNRRNHYTLWNLIFCFLSERFLWNRNQSLCPCAYTTTQCALHMHIRHIILHFRLFIGYENENEFRCFCCLDLCVSCVGTTNRHLFERRKNSVTSAVGCSTNVTRVLECFSQKNLWSICADICHCRKEKYVLKCSHI